MRYATPYLLSKVGVGFDDHTERMVGYQMMDLGPIQAILRLFPAFSDPWLDVQCDGGVTLQLLRAHAGEDEFLELFFYARAGNFASDLTAEVRVSHEADCCVPGDHRRECPYASAGWPVDEEGNRYWLSHDGMRHYRPACWCEPVVDNAEIHGVETLEDLHALVARTDAIWEELCRSVR